jgi:hypothetical protein
VDVPSSRFEELNGFPDEFPAKTFAGTRYKIGRSPYQTLSSVRGTGRVAVVNRQALIPRNRLAAEHGEDFLEMRSGGWCYWSRGKTCSRKITRIYRDNICTMFQDPPIRVSCVMPVAPDAAVDVSDDESCCQGAAKCA